MNTITKAARHVGTTAGPAEHALQKQVYRNRDSRSTVNPLEQAADCLLALQLGADAAERQLLSLLFARRMERAYGGQCR